MDFLWRLFLFIAAIKAVQWFLGWAHNVVTRYLRS